MEAVGSAQQAPHLSPAPSPQEDATPRPTRGRPRGSSRAVVGTCKHCQTEDVPLNRHQLLCLDRCYPEHLEARRGPAAARVKRAGNDVLVGLFERFLGPEAYACMTEVSVNLSGRMIYPKSVRYYDKSPDTPTATQVFCVIVGKYDRQKRLLVEMAKTFPNKSLYIPRRFGAYTEFHPTSQPVAFSLTDYLHPDSSQALQALQDLTAQMNNTAHRVLMPSELMLAVTLYHANVAQLQKPTVSSLFEVFRRVLLMAQGLRVQEEATKRYQNSPTKVITITEVNKLVGLLKAERDLMGEIGGSPRAAKKLGMTSGDALSAMIERAPRPGHSEARETGSFDGKRELDLAHRALSQEAGAGHDPAESDQEPMPEEEVDEGLQSIIADLDGLG